MAVVVERFICRRVLAEPGHKADSCRQALATVSNYAYNDGVELREIHVLVQHKGRCLRAWSLYSDSVQSLQCTCL